MGPTAVAGTILNDRRIAFGNETAIIAASITTCPATGCHVAFTIDRTNSCIFVNGNLETCAGDTTLYSTSAFYVGRYGGANQGYFKGHIKNFSIVQGVLYTGNFTPPTGPRC
jgi:hypothetical protein